MASEAQDSTRSRAITTPPKIIMEPHKEEAIPQIVQRIQNLQSMEAPDLRSVQSLSTDDLRSGRRSPSQHQTISEFPSSRTTEEVVDRTLKRRSRTIPNYLEQEVVVPEAQIKECLPNLLKYQGFLYDEKKAEIELSNCIAKFPKSVDQIRDALQSFRVYCKKHKSDRLEKVLFLALPNPNNASFFHCYFRNDENLNSFAKKAIRELNKNHNPAHMIGMLASFTELDLQNSPHRDSLFRQISISSALCREYGLFVWGKELEQFRHDIANELKKCGVEAVTLNRQYIRKMLSARKDFPTSMQQQEEWVQKEMKVHAEKYIPFARSILQKLYSLKVPVEFSDLLTMRRKKLMSSLETKFKAKDPLEASRHNLSELFFIRIICPEILSIFKLDKEESKQALVPLTKIINSLAFEVPFTEIDPVYFSFNPLVEEFTKTHLTFIDAHSLEKK